MGLASCLACRVPAGDGGPDTSTDESEDEDPTGGDGDEGQPACDPPVDDDPDLDDEYGYATVPPEMVLADSFYTYDLRTSIGACSTDRAWWKFESGPSDARLELFGTEVKLSPGEAHEHDSGGDAREHAKLAWDLDGIEPGCHEVAVRWRAWLDCGLGDDGEWGPEIEQRWQLNVRDNHWYSGDLHVHTQHSERGAEAGGVADYYRRMVNLETDDAGQDFADRRLRSLRGQLHWLVFSDHTNNELEECGRNFAAWCEQDEDVETATGREVARHWTEQDPRVLLVVGAEVSNQFDGHIGFLPKNPWPDHAQYAPGYLGEPTDYDYDAGFGAGVFRERWVDPEATNAEEIALVQLMGGLAIINHESAVAPWVEYDWSSLDFDGLEVWNGGNRHDQDDDSAYNGGIDLNEVTEGDLLTTEIPEDPIERSWLGMLKHGRWPLALVGGSDAHDFNEVVCFDGPCDPTNAELAQPTTSVWAEHFVWANGEDGISEGIERGRVVVHDRSNFIDLRIVHGGAEHMVGDTIDGYVAGDALHVRAFGRAADYVDGDNRVVLVMGTNGDLDDPTVDILYSSEDLQHFVPTLAGKSAMKKIQPDSNFDREVTTSLSDQQLGVEGDYFVWAQFLPWHNVLYAVGNGADVALTGAIRIRR